MAAFSASKGGLLALTRALVIELAPASIRVNAVLPSAMDIFLLRIGLARVHREGSETEELRRELADRTVIGRIGRPGQITEAVHFPADNTQSSLVTGQGLVVNGGATTRLSTE